MNTVKLKMNQRKIKDLKRLIRGQISAAIKYAVAGDPVRCTVIGNSIQQNLRFLRRLSRKLDSK